MTIHLKDLVLRLAPGQAAGYDLRLEVPGGGKALLSLEDHFNDLDELAIYIVMVFDTAKHAIHLRGEAAKEECKANILVLSALDPGDNKDLMARIDLLGAEAPVRIN